MANISPSDRPMAKSIKSKGRKPATKVILLSNLLKSIAGGRTPTKRASFHSASTRSTCQSMEDDDSIRSDECREYDDTCEGGDHATPTRKTVSFAATPSILPTLSRVDYTYQEIRAAWYTSREYSVISQTCAKQVRQMEKGIKLKDQKYCSRGLESFTWQASVQKKRTRTAAYDAVLVQQQEAQERPFNYLKRSNDEKIAQMYHRTSSSCQLWASAVGLRDQKEAESYLFDFY